MSELSTTDLIAAFLSTVLTLMVLSYLIGDNPLFRLAIHLFIGVASGYAGAIAWHNVLKPGLVDPLLQAGLAGLTQSEALITLIAPWVLVLLLLLKLSPRTARFGTLSMAVLVGVGAAVVVGGAITGTLIPQSIATMESLSPSAVSPQTGETGFERMLNVGIILVGTLATLLYFRFSTRRERAARKEPPLAIIAGQAVPGPLALLRAAGQTFIAITFGVMYAGALSASLIAMAERIQFLRDTLNNLIGALG